MTAQTFGPNGVIASRFAYGAMQWGGRASEADSEAMYHACRAAGITLFDTAHDYTGGASEQILGRLVAPERDKIILITKVGAKGGSGRANILAQFEESLRRLNLDSVDVLFLHRWDANTPLEETLQACEELRQAGKFHHLGVSNFSAWQTMKAIAVGAREGFKPLEFLQPMYNLVKRQAEVEILPMAISEELSVISYSPLGGGLLTGKYMNEGAQAGSDNEGRLSIDPHYAKRYGPDWMRDAAERLHAIAAHRGLHPATLAVAWAALHPGITAPIISGRSVEQLKPSLDALTMTFDDELIAAMNALTPTPPPATDRLEEQDAG